MNDQFESVAFNVGYVHFVGSFEDLQNVFVVDVVLQVVLTKRL